MITGIEWGSLHGTPTATLQVVQSQAFSDACTNYSAFPKLQPGQAHPAQPTCTTLASVSTQPEGAHCTLSIYFCRHTHQNRFSRAISVSNSCTSWRNKSKPETTLTYVLDAAQGHSSSLARLFSDLSSLNNPPGTSFSTCKGRDVWFPFFFLTCLFISEHWKWYIKTIDFREL